jgi:energy-coupling factor transport system ATP-binding protein
MAALRAEQLSFAFGDGALLAGVNLAIQKGELVVLAGGNGSGKTTLLRLLSGLLQPVSGRVWIDDAASSLRSQVALLFQNPDLQMIASSVEEELALGMELRGISPQDMQPRVERLLERFELGSLQRHSPEALSGGQKQRVAVAAIMAADPGYLLLDEPDSHLDASSRNDLLKAIEQVRPVCGILWTVPNPNRMIEADRYVLLSGGTIHETSRADLIRMASGSERP